MREFDQKNFAEIDAGIVATQIMLAIEAEGLALLGLDILTRPVQKSFFRRWQSAS